MMKLPEDFLAPHQEPGVTEEEFAAFEETYGVVLPEDMKAFYRRQNGGSFKRGQGYILGDDEDALRLRAFHPIARAFVDYFLTIDTLLKWQQMDEFIPKTLVPFCSDAGGDFYYIQADGEGENVYYIFHEDDDEFLDHPEDCLRAKSFTDFLDRIRVEGSE